MQSLIICLIGIIPIYFSELNESIYLLPLILIIFAIRNSIMITEYYINSYNLFSKRNFIAATTISIYLIILNIFSIHTLEYFIITHIVALLIYKIVISLFLQKFFTNNSTILKILFGDILMALIISMFAFIVIIFGFTIIESILLALLSSTIILFVHMSNPKKSFKNLLLFLDKKL